MISAVVLAAGASTRMGQAKAALPLGQTGETVVSRVVRTLLDGGAPEVIVVAGAHIDAVRAAMPPHEPRARIIEHLGWERGQLSSLIAGLEAIDTPLVEAALVTLVDVPMVRASTVAAVIEARDALGLPQAILLPNPVAQDKQLPPEELDAILDRAWSQAAAQGITGNATTPFLLDFIQRDTGGRSLDVNVEVYRGNVALGGRIAAALAG